MAVCAGTLNAGSYVGWRLTGREGGVKVRVFAAFCTSAANRRLVTSPPLSNSFTLGCRRTSGACPNSAPRAAMQSMILATPVSRPSSSVCRACTWLPTCHRRWVVPALQISQCHQSIGSPTDLVSVPTRVCQGRSFSAHDESSVMEMALYRVACESGGEM